MTSLHPSLPPKPISLEHELTTAHAPQHTYDAEQPEASSSTPVKPLCVMCAQQYSKYTCPGCAVRTCSAACSASHKAKTGCTGARNKVAYVPMNGFSWGKMMDDYVFLEDMGRKVGDWGKEIVRGGYMAGNTRGRGDARGRGRGTRGRGRGNTNGGGPPKTKRDILKMQLEVRDTDMELLPVGMERRKINQSTWDFKNQTAVMTIEFKFYKPKDPLAPSSQLREPPWTLLTHRNDTKLSLISLLQTHIHERGAAKKETSHPEWVKRLIYPDPDDPESFSNPQCVMAAPLDPTAVRDSRRKKEKAHYSFDLTQPLGRLLRHTQFVEFPTIEVWEQFEGVIVDAQGVMRPQTEDPPQKRRKMNPKAGKLAIVGLLGGYGSDEEQEVIQPKNGLVALGDYVASDEEDMAVDSVERDDHDGLEDAYIEEDQSDDDGDIELDPAVLLELMKAAGAVDSLEDDTVDWGEVDDGQMEY